MSIISVIAAAMTGLHAHAQVEVFDDKVWFEGHERARLEWRRNNVLFNSEVDADEDAWLLNRLRLGIGVKPAEWVRLYGEVQDAREIGSTRTIAGTNPNLEEDTADLRQAWLHVANYKEFPLGLKVGRQELSYGDERLIGAFDWNNVGRVFDAVKLRWQADKWWVEAFGANVIAVDDNSFDDKADWQDDFLGLYSRVSALEKHILDFYVLYRDKQDAEFNGAGRQNYTIGGRIQANDKLKPWDYFAEVAGQFGHVQSPGGGFGETTASWARQQALAGAIGVGFTFDAEINPRVGIEYNYASGDRDPTDGKTETFDNLFPTNHKFYGYADLMAWKNVHNPRITFSLAPHKLVKVQVDGHLFWLAESQDAWYRAGGTAIRRDATGQSSRYVGAEIDLTVSWNPHKRIKVLGGYSHFFAGSFVDDTQNPTASLGNDDADFLYTQVTLSL
jgi:hypothetical protein